MIRKNIIIIIIVIGVIIPIIIFGSIILMDRNHSKDEKLVIVIKPNINNVNYYVNIPILIINSEIPDIISDLEIKKGKGSYRIEDSEYGQVLNISTINEIVLESYIESNFLSIEDSEVYFDYEWSTIYFNLSKLKNGIMIRSGNNLQNGSLIIDIDVSFVANSNTDTTYEGSREYGYEYSLITDNQWKIIFGYDNSILA